MRLPCGDAGAAAPILWGSQACGTAALAVAAGDQALLFASRAGAPRRKLVLQWVLGASAALPLLGALFGEASAASPRMDACEQNPGPPATIASPAELAKRSPYDAAAPSQT
mgnify:CR=1 FL=1